MTAQNDLCPSTVADLSDMVLSARAPLQVCGGGTRPIGHVEPGAVLSTRRLSGVNLYEPGAMTLVAGAGTPVSEIDNMLRAENQHLAFEPMDHRVLLGTTGVPSLGGVFASNTSGPRRVQVGAARDSALGVQFVDGAGQIIQNGGRVMKNVTGYDLVKLMCGSWGTLGVLSEISCKVLPMPETAATVQVAVSGWDMVVPCLSRALGTPYDVNGAAGVSDGGQVYAIVRVEGFAASVAYRAKALQAELAAFGDCSIVENYRWSDIRDVVALKAYDTVWCVKLRPSHMGQVFEVLDQIDEYARLIDWGGGMLWVGLQHGDPTDDSATRVHSALQGVMVSLGGHTTLIKGRLPINRNYFQPQSPVLADVSAQLRGKFDPRGLLNPRRMG